MFVATLAMIVSSALGLTISSGTAASASPVTSSDTGQTGTAYIFEGKQVFPEGLVRHGQYLYSTSFGDGTVYRGRVDGTKMYPFLPAGQDGRTSATGVRVSGNRILVAGGLTGRFYIYTLSGRLVSMYTVPNPSAPSLVNDAAISPNGDVYITDSYRPVIYRISGAAVSAKPSSATQTLTAVYQLPDYAAGQSNGNGIVETADGKELIVGYYGSGALYRVNIASGLIGKLQLSQPLTSADGMILEGHTLIVARAAANVIAIARLAPDLSGATIVTQRSYPGVDTPTGIAIVGNRLLATNSQLDTVFFGAPQTSATFTIGSLALTR